MHEAEDATVRVYRVLDGDTVDVRTNAGELWRRLGGDHPQQRGELAFERQPATDHLVRQSLLQASPEGYLAMAHFAEALTDLLQSSDTQVVEQPKVTKQTTGTAKSDQAQPVKTEESQEKVTEQDIDSEQVAQLMAQLTKKNKTLIQVFSGQMGLAALLEAVGVSHRSHFKNKHLQPMIDAGIVSELYPDSPNHPNQAYYLTDLGQAVQQEIVESDQPHP